MKPNIEKNAKDYLVDDLRKMNETFKEEDPQIKDAFKKMALLIGCGNFRLTTVKPSSILSTTSVSASRSKMPIASFLVGRNGTAAFTLSGLEEEERKLLLEQFSSPTDQSGLYYELSENQEILRFGLQKIDANSKSLTELNAENLEVFAEETGADKKAIKKLQDHLTYIRKPILSRAFSSIFSTISPSSFPSSKLSDEEFQETCKTAGIKLIGDKQMLTAFGKKSLDSGIKPHSSNKDFTAYLRIETFENLTKKLNQEIPDEVIYFKPRDSYENFLSQKEIYRDIDQKPILKNNPQLDDANSVAIGIFYNAMLNENSSLEERAIIDKTLKSINRFIYNNDDKFDLKTHADELIKEISDNEEEPKDKMIKAIKEMEKIAKNIDEEKKFDYQKESENLLKKLTAFFEDKSKSAKEKEGLGNVEDLMQAYQIFERDFKIEKKEKGLKVRAKEGEPYLLEYCREFNRVLNSVYSASSVLMSGKVKVESGSLSDASGVASRVIGATTLISNVASTASNFVPIVGSIAGAAFSTAKEILDQIGRHNTLEFSNQLISLNPRDDIRIWNRFSAEMALKTTKTMESEIKKYADKDVGVISSIQSKISGRDDITAVQKLAMKHAQHFFKEIEKYSKLTKTSSYEDISDKPMRKEIKNQFLKSLSKEEGVEKEKEEEAPQKNSLTKTLRNDLSRQKTQTSFSSSSNSTSSLSSIELELNKDTSSSSQNSLNFSTADKPSTNPSNISAARIGQTAFLQGSTNGTKRLFTRRLTQRRLTMPDKNEGGRSN